MSLTINDLLNCLVDGARNAGQTDRVDEDGDALVDGDVYSLAEKHRAIQGVLRHFVRETWCTRQTNTVDLAEDTTAVSFSGISRFDEDRVLDIRVVSSPFATAVLTAGVLTSITLNYSLTYSSAPTVTFSGGGSGSGAAATANLTLGKITGFTVTNGGSGYTSVPSVLINGAECNYTPQDVGEPLLTVDEREIDSARANYGTSSGTPRRLAFSSGATGLLSGATVWPKPKADGILKVRWSPQLTVYNGAVAAEWPAGDNVGTYTLNVPDDMALIAVRTGGVVWLQNGQIENVSLTNVRYAEYLEHVRVTKGRRNASARSFQRSCQRRDEW